MKYYKNVDRLTNDEWIVFKRQDGSVIFFNNESPEYEKYLAWVAEGNTAEEWSAE